MFRNIVQLYSSFNFTIFKAQYSVRRWQRAGASRLLRSCTRLARAACHEEETSAAAVDANDSSAHRPSGLPETIRYTI